MNEYDFFSGRKDEVGLSGQILPVQPIAIPATMEEPAHDQFGTGVFCPYGLHNPTTLFFGASIGHTPKEVTVFVAGGG